MSESHRIRRILFFSHATTTDLYTLSLHDALPIFPQFLHFPDEKHSGCRPHADERRFAAPPMGPRNDRLGRLLGEHSHEGNREVDTAGVYNPKSVRSHEAPPGRSTNQ